MGLHPPEMVKKESGDDLFTGHKHEDRPVSQGKVKRN